MGVLRLPRRGTRRRHSTVSRRRLSLSFAHARPFCRHAFLKAWTKLVEYVTEKFKKESAGFSDANLYNQRDRALDNLRSGNSKLWADINKRINIYRQKKKEAKKAIHPEHAQCVIGSVEAWNTSAEFREWKQEVEAVHRRVAIEKGPPPKEAEYESILSLTYGCITTGNASRAGQVGSIRNVDYWQMVDFNEGEAMEDNDEDREEAEEEEEEAAEKAAAIGGAVITVTSEPGRFLKTGHDQHIYLTGNTRELLEKYLEVKEAFFGGKQMQQLVEDADASLFVTSKGKDVSRPRDKFFEAFASAAKLSKASANIAR